MRRLAPRPLGVSLSLVRSGQQRARGDGVALLPMAHLRTERARPRRAVEEAVRGEVPSWPERVPLCEIAYNRVP